MIDAERMMKRQQVLADFGEFALRSDDLDAVLTEACRLVGEAMGTGRAKVLEIEDGGKSLLVRAGVGWEADIVGRLRMPMGEHTSETFAINEGKPVISQDIRKEDRFDIPEFMKEAGVVAFVNVPIFVPGKKPFGLLEVDATERRDFGDDEIQFLRTYATILGPVIDRLLKVQELQSGEERFRLTVENARDYAIFLADPEDKITDWFPGAEAVFGWPAEEAIGQPSAITYTPEDREHGVPEQEAEIARKEGKAPNVRWHARKGGARIFIEGSRAALRDEHGSVRGFLKIGQDVTERRALAERNREILESISDAFYAVDRDWRFTYVNRKAEEWWGRKREELIGKVYWEEFPNAVGSEAYQAHLRAAETREVVRLETVSPILGHWVDVSIYPAEDGGLSVYFRDISGRKRTEAALRESEARYRTLFEAIDQGFYFIRAIFDEEGRCTDLFYQDENPAAARMTGRSFVGKRLSELGDYEPYWRDIFGRVARTGEPSRMERYAEPDGRWYDFYVFKPPHAGPDELAVVFRDVSERQRAEMTLRDSEARFRTLAESIEDVFYMTDLEGWRIIYLSPSYERVWGQPRTELLAQSSRFLDTVHPDDRPAFRAGMERQARDEPVTLEYRIVRPDGEVRWILDRSFPIASEDGGRRAAGIASDITARKQADARLREGERRLRVLTEGIPQLVWRSGDRGHWTWASAQWIEFTGQRQGESHGRGWLDVVHPDDRGNALAAWGEAGARRMLDVEYRIRRAEDGAFVWHHTRALPVENEQGEVVEWLGTSTDIQGLKEVEERLREAEERFRLIVENARDYAILLSDENDRITDWLPVAQAVFGWTADEIVGQPGELLFTPEDRAGGVPQAELETARRQGAAPDIRWHQRKDGGRVFIDGQTVALRHPDGSLRGFLKIGQDVTERRAEQERLARSEALFRTLATGIEELVFLGAPDGSRSWGSPQWVDYTGLPFVDSLGFGWLDAVHPDDRGATLARWHDAQKSGSYYAEHRVRRTADGAWRWHLTRARPIRPDDPARSEWVGASTDVHPLRELQEGQAVLVAELQHRTRNIVTIVRSLADRTAASSASLKDFQERFRARIEALGRVQSLLSKLGEGQRVSFDALVRAEFSAHGALDGGAGKVTLDGPGNVRLRSAHVQTLALALHELATNAVKYGALAWPDGRLSLRWRVERGQKGRALVVEWAESGVPLPPGFAPKRKGYGRELIERALPYQLKAETRYEIGPDGVRCTIRMPLSDPAA